MSSFRHGFVVALFALFAAFFLPQTSHAAIGALDDTPGSSLLFPYFEVDLDHPTGRDTVLTVQNASATAMLAHTIVWSDEGVASAIFDIYLTGYDIMSFSMRDVLDGSLPLTGSDGQDPTDTISPQGPFSQDINFASCSTFLPYAPGTIPAPAGMTPADLRKALTGAPTSGVAAGMCWGRNVGDGHARGYVTMDLVNRCSDLKPGDAGYLDSPLNTLTSQNSLLGSFVIANPDTHEWFVDNALSIEAAYTNDPSVTTPGNYTFYGRYNGWNAADRREPLPTTWMAQGELDTSSLIVWRDTKTDGQPHACGTAPGYYPLGQEGFATFGPDSSYGSPGAGTPLANAAQLVPASVLGTVGSKLGQFFANLNASVPAAGGNPPADPAAAQGYIGVMRPSLGEMPMTPGHRAVPLDSALDAQHYVPHN
ncbi:hypothetical protein [Dokdonella fugitiva]|jgi:hypothetical protein|uniref:Uncharacterized protein n=1 Tax=Dokdonella fugitiva TaxID=328517 RepID=A0A4R2IHF1_9GAMM|nr:hypothetical protein [Dokdonella fugitiva]TCO43178.1 hypothetical protein EV148_101597 [Dokdonella fugitiva]